MPAVPPPVVPPISSNQKAETAVPRLSVVSGKEAQKAAIAKRFHSQGIATLSHHGNIFRFRTNPNSITWTYNLNSKVLQTYGGRVVQTLSTNISDLTVKIDCGKGGWPYAMQVCQFLSEMLATQRGGQPGIFEYTVRNWKLHVYAVSVPFQDQVTSTVRELELTFKVQEDVSGALSQLSLGQELSRLKNGIGFKRNQYNSPEGSYQDADQGIGYMANFSRMFGDMGTSAMNELNTLASNIPFIGNTVSQYV